MTLHASLGEITLFVLSLILMIVNVYAIMDAWKLIHELKKDGLNGSLRYQAIDRLVLSTFFAMIQCVVLTQVIVVLFSAPPASPPGIYQARVRIVTSLIVSLLTGGATLWMIQTRNVLDSLPWTRNERRKTPREGVPPREEPERRKEPPHA